MQDSQYKVNWKEISMCNFHFTYPTRLLFRNVRSHEERTHNARKTVRLAQQEVFQQAKCTKDSANTKEGLYSTGQDFHWQGLQE